MADNIQVNAGSGPIVSTDDIGGGVQVQRIKVGYGIDGVYSDASTTSPLPIRQQGLGTGAYGAVSVTTTATSIRSSTSTRTGILIVNNGSSVLYLGQDNSVTTSNGLPIQPGQAFNDSDYTGDIYGIVGSGTNDVRYWVVS